MDTHLDALIEAGADLAQALQDVVDAARDGGDGDECADLVALVDAWEAAYARIQP